MAKTGEERRQTHKREKNITIVLIEIRAYVAYTLIIIIFIRRLLYIHLAMANGKRIPFCRFV